MIGMDRSPAQANLATTSRGRRYARRRSGIQRLRVAVQAGFALVCVWIGVEFHYFAKYLSTAGAEGFAYRPPGVEGFLPISSMMSLRHWLGTGEIHPAHPAGLFIFVGILVMSLALGKSFCSWVCPVGLLSEKLAALSKRVFRVCLTPPRWLDWPLRSLKYFLLAFFAVSTLVIMSPSALRLFLDSPYNLVSDLKMYYFFADISALALTVIVTLLVFSTVIHGFWCRYLCPYGALLGLLSLVSPIRIKRNATSCIDCGKCARVCPAFIKVDRVDTVRSDECTSCLRCIDSCPVAETLELRLVGLRRSLSTKAAVGVALGLFLTVIGLAMVTGHWHNRISTGDYLYYNAHIESYGHPTGTREIEELNSEADRPRSSGSR